MIESPQSRWARPAWASVALTLTVVWTVACDSGAPVDSVAVADLYDFDEVSTLPGGGTMEFVWIKPGSYQRGSPAEEKDRGGNEGPRHPVTLSHGFWLGKYEVTQRQWWQVMETQPWSRGEHVELNDDHPAVFISWLDVQNLLAQLNNDARESLYRLPSEAEWEYAARAGTSTPWSFPADTGPEHAWTYENTWSMGREFAQPVGTRLPNPWGLHDMHGNVFEWCRDRFGPYSTASLTDPQGPNEGLDRVVRGGGFGNPLHRARSAARSPFTARGRFSNIGVRLVRVR